VGETFCVVAMVGSFRFELFLPQTSYLGLRVDLKAIRPSLSRHGPRSMSPG
jgi:hypothetical protein